MPTDVTRYTVLLSSPGDAAALCKVADGAIRAINRTHSATTGVELYPTDWRRDSRADSGAEPQALLNRQIVDDADIILAIFYQRYGTPTAGYGSGTEEEIRRGLGQGKTVLLYIWAPSAGFEPDDPEQFEKIGSLRDELGKAVMYKRFSNERELEQEVTHDLTRLVFELEGGGKSPKPSLSLVCLDENDKPASAGLLVGNVLCRSRLDVTLSDERIREALREATSYAVYDSHAVDGVDFDGMREENPLSMWQEQGRMPATFDYEDKALVAQQLNDMGIEPPADLFCLGNVSMIPSIGAIYSGGMALDGSDDEKAKYEALKKLVEACHVRRDFIDWITSLSGTGAIALSLENSGGMPARHVCVEVFVPSEALVPHDFAPGPSDFLVGHRLDEYDQLDAVASHLYGIGESASLRPYGESAVLAESGKRALLFRGPRPDLFPYGRQPLERTDFRESVDWLFGDYSTAEDAETGITVIRLSFDRIQQNATYAFPTVLLVNGDFKGPLRYRITADELSHAVEGELSVLQDDKGTNEKGALPGETHHMSEEGSNEADIGNSKIDPDADGETTEDGAQLRRNKPMLTVPQQIAHLEAKGVSFNLCSKEEATSYLTSRTYLFKLMAYRELFEKRVGGERDGQYVGLDFGYLQELASLDRDLRYTLLPMTLDVEHFAHAKLMAKATELEGEDGCAVVADYMASLNHKERNRRTGEVKALRADIYCGDLVEKYSLPDEMPLWAYLELASFGSFIDLYLFCAERWEDGRMRDEHYLLRQAKACRNACAHSSDMLNGFGKVDPEIATNAGVSRALAEVGVSRRVRQSKMRNPRLKQIVTLLYLYGRIVPEGTSRHRAEKSAAKLATSMRRVMKDIPHNDAVQSSLGFLVTLLDKWF